MSRMINRRSKGESFFFTDIGECHKIGLLKLVKYCCQIGHQNICKITESSTRLAFVSRWNLEQDKVLTQCSTVESVGKKSVVFDPFGIR